ncbi:MAG: TonB-dependent receptor plug domain-containing protein, partial [Bacteroidota bacterium]|nr:TonB-dependent receptor plug domain-containing protein [Bacteroidota bacterium]
SYTAIFTIKDDLYNIRFDIELQAEDIKLQEIIVKADKETGNGISSITVSPEILNQLPSLSGEVDLFRSLQLLPGVTINNELSSGLYIRGGTPDQNLTLVDGVIVYNPSHLGNFASTFNSDALQNVKLIKGAFPAEYGGRLGSVLDVKLRNGSKEKNKLIFGAGLINSHLTLEGPLTGNSTYMFSGRKMYYDALQQIIDKDGTTPRYNFYDMNSKLTFYAGGNTIISLSTLMSSDNIYSPTKSPVNYDIQWKNATVSLCWSQILSQSRFSNASLSYINYKFKSILNDTSSSSLSSDYYSVSELQDFVAKEDLQFFISENNIGKLGFDFSLHKYQLNYNDVYSYLIEYSSGSEREVINYEIAAFLQSEWQITPLIKLNSGGRFYYFNDRKFFEFEPRLNASINLDENVSIKGGFAVANQFLHLIIKNDISLPTDLWYPSKAEIEPAHSKQYVFGVESYFAEREYLFSVEGYYKQMKNLYEFKDNGIYSSTSPLTSLFTKGEGEAYGVEFFLNKMAGNVSGWAGYTLSWTRRKFDDLNMGKVFFPKFDRRHDISVILTYKIFDNLSLGITWIYASGQGFTLPIGQYRADPIGLNPQSTIQYDYMLRNQYKLPDYHKLDLNITYKFNWGRALIETYLNIYNVYNRKNAFAYIASEDKIKEEGNSFSIPKFHSISLFPFIPSVGFNIKL